MPELRFETEIGKGGFCRVHHISLVDDDGTTADLPPLAAKSLREDLSEPPETEKEIRNRFEREARLLDEVLDHPNIVDVYYRNLSRDPPFYVMPLASSTVANELQSRAGDEEWVAQVFRQVLAALAYAHGKGVIHRDLKPENILLFDESHVALSDFGLGKNIAGGTTGLTRTAQWSGTEPYMAPEQFTAMKATGPEADVFALGKLLMILLTGETPEVGAPDVSAVPEKYRYFVHRCCERQPENRFGDAREASEAFERTQSTVAFAQPPTETLLDLVEAWFAAPRGEDLAVLASIDEHLRSHPTEEAMFTKQVPRLPEALIDQYMDARPDGFVEMIGVYDGHVSGGLPFEYCDVVADFFERVFRRTNRPDLRKLILSRMVEMGFTHNRWHVRDRSLSLLEDHSDPSAVALAVDVLTEHEEGAAWLGEAAADRTLPRQVSELLSASSSA